MTFERTLGFFFVFCSMMSIGYSLRRRNIYFENPYITDLEIDGILNVVNFTDFKLHVSTQCSPNYRRYRRTFEYPDNYDQEIAKTIIPYYMCEFCQSHCVNYTDMQLQYVLKPHNEIKGQNTLVPIHIVLQCSVWRYIIEDTEWLENLPEDIHSLYFKDRTILRCHFEKHVFQKCIETIAISAFNTSSITCLSEDFSMQSYLLFKSQCTKHLSYNYRFIYPLISLIIFLNVIIICICKRLKACHGFNRPLKRYNNFSNGTIYRFDAFISHSHADTEWVIQFHKRLEEMEFKICFDAKDFVPGALITANIENAFKKSRNAIFIITQNFMMSGWGEYELETAHTYVQKKKLQHIIIVLNLKNDIISYKKTNVLKQILKYATCIKWSQSEDRSNNCQESDCYEQIYKILSKNKTTVV